MINGVKAVFRAVLGMLAAGILVVSATVAVVVGWLLVVGMATAAIWVPTIIVFLAFRWLWW